MTESARRQVAGRGIPVPGNDIDTDRIIPARFLKTVTNEGLGLHAFEDARKQDPEHPFNQKVYEGAAVLVAGLNFGCGSSREHAPWALVDWGFRAVISSSIADIFSNNAVKNGLLPVRVDAGFHSRLLAEPGSEVFIDLEHRTVRLADGTEATFPLDPFARYCLMNGVDELGFLLGQDAAITRFEEART